MAKRILIVDDDEMVRIALSELLKPEGYEIDSVGSAKEALDKLEEEKYDLLVLDIIMPQMDGLELCRRVRAMKDLVEVPIILLTAKTREQDRIDGMEAGANLFLSKPISPAKLVEVVSETIG
jgi:DNA-binding response OmpR family regulator